MIKKTLIADFFTTISISQYFDSIYLMTFRLPLLRKGKDIFKFENDFKKYLKVMDSKITSFYNGRSALYHILKSIGIKRNDEIIVSGYTCVTVSNAVIQSGGKIIYSDINKKNLGIDVKSLEENITNKTKVIIVQHTFGKPSDIKKIISVAKKFNILVIEDCAHSLGSEINGQKLGTFGDFAIFSTGRDKVISSVTGGLLLINNEKYFKCIKKIETKLQLPSIILTLRNLNYNLAGKEAYTLYDISVIGKLTIYLSRKLKLITEILTKSEKKCNYKNFNLSLPNSLAYLGINQLNKIEKTINHNIKIANIYNELIDNKKVVPLFKIKKNELNNYYRYPILLKNKEELEKLYKYMKKNNIILGKTWSLTNIAPLGTDFKKAKYIKKSCINAENISNRILFLPNNINISTKDTKKIIKLINKF